MNRILALFLFFSFCCLVIFSPMYVMAAPTSKMVKEVVDYFYNGQTEGPILADAKMCKTVKSLSCEEPADPKAFTLGEPIKIWMQFFVPKGGTYDDIFVEYKHEGVPRNLAAHKVEGSIRYRLVDSYKLNKLGKWTITIKKGLTVLRTFDVNVIDK
jgi:hypothetical protein